MQSFDDNFQTLLRNGLAGRAAKLEGVNVQFEDAQRDVGRQLSQIDNFIASGVDAIIVTLADTTVAPAITSAAEAAGIPLVYLSLEPVNVGAAARQSGLCRLEERPRPARSAPPRPASFAGRPRGMVPTPRYVGISLTAPRCSGPSPCATCWASRRCDFIEIADAQQAGWSASRLRTW